MEAIQICVDVSRTTMLNKSRLCDGRAVPMQKKWMPPIHDEIYVLDRSIEIDVSYVRNNFNEHSVIHTWDGEWLRHKNCKKKVFKAVSINYELFRRRDFAAAALS